MHVSLSSGKVSVDVAAASPDEVAAAIDIVRDCFTAQKADEGKHEVPIVFWQAREYDDEGDRSKTLAMVPWDDVAGNYAGETRRSIEPLVRGFEPGRGGGSSCGTVLRGPAKTYALRALAWEWRSWCRLHYVSDPEVLMANPRYLRDVAAAEPEPGEPPWRLVALEDTGER